MLEGVDLTALEVKGFGGADIAPAYQPPKPLSSPETPKEDGLKQGNGQRV